MPGKKLEEKQNSRAHLEFEKRITLAAKEAVFVRRSMKVWGILTALGAVSSILLLLFYLFKK